MDERQIVDIWLTFKEYLDKKTIADAAERYVDTLIDYGVSDATLKESLNFDSVLDDAIQYYFDDYVDDDDFDNDEDW